jgi:hypothetical protein
VYHKLYMTFMMCVYSEQGNMQLLEVVLGAGVLIYTYTHTHIHKTHTYTYIH